MYKDYITYQVETTEGKEWIARYPKHGNVGGSGKTKQEAIDDAIRNLKVELSLKSKESRSML